MTKAKDIDEYLENLNEKDKAALEKLRQIIKSAAPEAIETISYGMPAFRFHGMLVGFAAWKAHYGFYPWLQRQLLHLAMSLKDS